MSFPIISADERLQQQSGVKGQIYGKFGIGKTSLLRTLDPADTLCIDLEAGMKSVQDWGGDSLSVRDWPTLRDITCWICGPNPALPSTHVYSQAHYNAMLEAHGPAPEKYKTVFIDSTSNATRYCLTWAQQQPEAVSDRSGKPDLRGAYGLLGREVVAWAEQWQHKQNINVWLVGGLEMAVDDLNRPYWKPLLEGSKGANTIPYIFDQIISMAEIRPDDGEPFRALVCQTVNRWAYPAKDRSGKLSEIEAPDLTKLMNKINNKGAN